MFKKFVKEMLEAKSYDQVLNILFRADGVDMMYQKEKLSWNDHETLFKMASRLKF